MEPTTELEPIPPKKPGLNSYRPEDIKRWGVQRFLDERAAQGPFKIPPMHFTAKENQRMDDILAQKRKATADSL